MSSLQISSEHGRMVARINLEANERDPPATTNRQAEPTRMKWRCTDCDAKLWIGRSDKNQGDEQCPKCGSEVQSPSHGAFEGLIMVKYLHLSFFPTRVRLLRQVRNL